MSATSGADGELLTRAHALVRTVYPGARAFWFTDLDLVAARAARLREALAPLKPRIAYALKANGLPALVRVLREAGLHADAGSLGELELARACGFDAAHRTLSGNGRTPEEAAWVAEHGVAAVSADHPGELDLLERAVAVRGGTLHVALRVNPGIVAGAHPHIETGHRATKFGMSVEESLEVFATRSRWPHLVIDGLHLHVGSQVDNTVAFSTGAGVALDLAHAASRVGGRVASINLGGGFAVDYEGGAEPLDLHALAAEVGRIAKEGYRDPDVQWCFEPGRWLVANAGVLVSEVLWDKRRRDAQGESRFVVLAAGMNDLLRPALYGARHRLHVLAPREGPRTKADVVGPVCESADRFLAQEALPPLESGDLVGLMDTGAYGSVMSSNYNGRSRLAEVVLVNGELAVVRGPEPLDARIAPLG